MLDLDGFGTMLSANAGGVLGKKTTFLNFNMLKICVVSMAEAASCWWICGSSKVMLILGRSNV